MFVLKKVPFNKVSLPEYLWEFAELIYTKKHLELILSSDDNGYIRSEEFSSEELENAYRQGVLNKEVIGQEIFYKLASFETRISCIIQGEKDLWNSLPKNAFSAFSEYMMDFDRYLVPKLDKEGVETVLPLENAKEKMEKSDGFFFWTECDCHSYIHGCDRDKSEVCLHFPDEKPGLNTLIDRGIVREVSKKDAIESLVRADKDGLVHSFNGRTICNCCSCCCFNFLGAKKFDLKDKFIKTPYLAYVDSDTCINCGACISKCQFEALKSGDECMEVDADKCWGCGVCRVECPVGALKMVLRK